MTANLLPALVRLTMVTKRQATGSSEREELLFAAYIDGLADLPEHHVLEACRRWPTLPERGKWWPALEELRGVADDVACEQRMRSLPKPVVNGHTLNGAAPFKPRRSTPAELAHIRKLVADLRANPGKYVAAKALADLGDAMLARAAEGSA
jgi:hypothetical protein